MKRPSSLMQDFTKAVLFGLVSLWSLTAQSDTINGSVVKIADGQTITILTASNSGRARYFVYTNHCSTHHSKSAMAERRPIWFGCNSTKSGTPKIPVQLC
jgi:metal-dependent HD superfamily phosphatase/phosphodiesterase